MRALPALCLLGSAALHVLAWAAWSSDVAAEPRPTTALAAVAVVIDALEEEPGPLPAPTTGLAVPPASETTAPAERAAVHAWREPGAPAPVEPAVAPAVVPEPSAEHKPSEVELPSSSPPSAPPVAKWTRVGPPPGLRVPPAVLRGTPVADLVIDPREASFLDRARALGMRFIVFQDGALGFYLELQGHDFRTAVRRTEIDANQFSRRARDLAGVATFDRLRNDIARRYGLDESRCRLAALVPVVIDHAFRGEESAALVSLGRPAGEVLALCGALTGDASRPLRITHALTTDNLWLELKS